jgi:hypothetical protein
MRARKERQQHRKDRNESQDPWERRFMKERGSSRTGIATAAEAAAEAAAAEQEILPGISERQN